ncbi:MAG: c-type cytochrome [Gammaproteobacteria bacterium]
MDHDKKFFDTFMLILGSLVLFTVAMFFLANYLGDTYIGDLSKESLIAQAQTNERLQPMGSVRLEGDPDVGGSAVATTTTPSAAPQAADGKAIYEGACAVCHGMGIAGAPKFGDAAAWKDRVAHGADTLVEQAINGYQGTSGLMPPKGGRADLSDADVKAAVEYMVENSQ